MDCLTELDHIEKRLDGSLQEMAAILATVDDPIEQMVLACLGVQKYRTTHEGEALNFTEQETLWRVGAIMRRNHGQAR